VLGRDDDRVAIRGDAADLLADVDRLLDMRSARRYTSCQREQ
jgi:hypothetical protein